MAEETSCNAKRLNEKEALEHLFTKLKGALVLQLWPKLIGILNQSRDKVVIRVNGKEQQYPASLVKAVSSISSNFVNIGKNYDIREVANLFEILQKPNDYKCLGMTEDYTQWGSIKTFVNMKELADKFGMTEVSQFLEGMSEFLTIHNKNAFDLEVQRRREKEEELKQRGEQQITQENKETEETMNKKESLPVKASPEKKRGRSKSKTRSLSRILTRSLSRGRKTSDA